MIPIKRSLLRALDKYDDHAESECLVDPLDCVCSNTFLRDHRHEIVLFYQLQHDLRPTDKLSVDVELRELRPRRKILQPLLQLLIEQNVDALILDLQVVQLLYHLFAGATGWHLRRPPDEDYD